MPRTYFRFKLSEPGSKEFESLAKHHGLSTGGLSRLVVQQFLADSRKASLPIGLPAELSIIANRRLAILNGWEQAIERRAGTIHQATVKFLHHLLQKRGTRLSKETLYGWRQQYLRRGIAGLIDHRRWKRNARLASGKRRRSADWAIEGPSIGV
jgi:hypothetical protein